MAESLVTFRHPHPVAMLVRGTEAEVRQMCSGHFPQVGERYVWECTAVVVEEGRVDVQFQLVRLEDSGDA